MYIFAIPHKTSFNIFLRHSWRVNCPFWPGFEVAQYLHLDGQKFGDCCSRQAFLFNPGSDPGHDKVHFGFKVFVNKLEIVEIKHNQLLEKCAFWILRFDGPQCFFSWWVDINTTIYGITTTSSWLTISVHKLGMTVGKSLYLFRNNCYKVTYSCLKCPAFFINPSNAKAPSPKSQRFLETI